MNAYTREIRETANALARAGSEGIPVGGNLVHPSVGFSHYDAGWQQMIKRFDLSIAYANRSMAILWTALWSVVIFHESLSVKQIIGIVLVVIGTVTVNIQTDKKTQSEEDKA